MQKAKQYLIQANGTYGYETSNKSNKLKHIFVSINVHQRFKKYLILFVTYNTSRMLGHVSLQ